jgi:hypothetical protein
VSCEKRRKKENNFRRFLSHTSFNVTITTN